MHACMHAIIEYVFVLHTISSILFYDLLERIQVVGWLNEQAWGVLDKA